MAENETKKRTPAYVSYTTFKNAISKLEHVPDVIDYSVYDGMNGSTRAFLFGALKFFGLIDEKGKPSSEFRQMANGGEDEWKSTLKTLIEKHYADQLKDLKGGTPASLRKSFGEDIGGSVVTPACRFLVQAAKDSGVPVSDTISKGKFSSGARRKKTGKGRTPREGGEGAGDESSSNTPKTPEGMLTLPLHFIDKPTGSVTVPRDFDSDDLEMLKAALMQLEVRAKRSSTTNSDNENEDG